MIKKLVYSESGALLEIEFDEAVRLDQAMDAITKFHDRARLAPASGNVSSEVILNRGVKSPLVPRT